MRTAAIIVFFSPCFQNVRSQTASRPDLDSLVATERAFARASVELGIRESFFAFFADDGIVFQPHPVRYKEAARNRPAPENPLIVTLTWEPIVADIASSADLGYTTGPFLLTDHSPQKRPPQHGFFFSVWKAQANGEWKVVLDLGIRTPEAYAGPRALVSGRPVLRGEKTIGSLETEKLRLLALEREFSDDAKSNGVFNAYEQRLASSARLHRPGRQPLLNRDSIHAFLTLVAGQTWKPMFADVSNSADLGYTYGRYGIVGKKGEGVESGYYARVWKREGTDEWKIVMDVQSAIPKKE